MRLTFKIIVLVTLLVLEILLVYGCSNNKSERPPRLKPVYHGIDDRAKPLVLKYVQLAKENNVKFTKPLTVGFTDINDGKAVGSCWMASSFREIDIDTTYWYKLESSEREELIFHELTHCLCYRLHDYDDGKAYTPTSLEFLDDLFSKYLGVQKPGLLKDQCPKSIMYPHVLWSRCMRNHRDEYYKEMFNRCKAW